MKTINLKLPDPRRWYDLPTPAAAALVIFLLLLIGLIVGRVRSTTQVATVPTPALDPIIIIATPQIGPTPPPAAMVAAVLPRFVVCYDQPVNGAVLGPIPAPDASAIVAHYGAAWVMTPWNGGYCWLRAADVGLPDVADLAPTEAPQVVYQVVSQPAAPVYQVTNEQPADAAPTPEPPALQTLAPPADEEPLSPALLREAQDR